MAMAVEFGRRGVRKDAAASGQRAPLSPTVAEPVSTASPSTVTVVAAVLAAMIVGATALLDARAATPTLVVTFGFVVFVLRRDVAAFFKAEHSGLGGFVMPRLLAAAIAFGVLAAGLLGPVAAQGMTVAVFAIVYMMVSRAFGELGETVKAAKAVRTAPRRSRWFVIGLIAGAAFFLVNDRMGWVPLSLSEALGVTPDKSIVAVEQSGILPQMNSTFSYTKNGFATQAPAGPGAAGVSETEWERLKAWISLSEGVSWYLDLLAFAAAAGFLLNTIMVRFLGFADTGDIKSDD
jgi:hypothetical protein